MADGSSSFDLVATIDKYNVPDICLIIAGIVALLIVVFYLKDKEGAKYKLLVLLGVIVGIVTVAACLLSTKATAFGTILVISIGCFALIIRPFRDINFALILAIMAMVIAYMLLGTIDKSSALGALSDGWARIIAAFVIGAVVYMLLGFLQALVQLAAKFLNAWPVLFVVGILCIVEGILILNGYSSIYDIIIGKVRQSSSIISMLMIAGL